ncbi:P-II family nitrogen regulator [Clostridium grantii]|uniref:Nitrogen regulatory protein P-II family n=1 Tax=Clostridium grantii DSM 8605 TaxID=1121316 RepID=A0A1M5UWT6_9CLOT|nr:P-II family nitrogen regulator [Clostridium grantii]SHH67432.1 nitrogen regulatory protein P-II family [Clostridium grantii DSM 8605]
MKEVLAIIRMNKINDTKHALLNNGFPSFNCVKVLGRGKQKVDFSMLDGIDAEALAKSSWASSLVESYRLIPKRMVSLVVKDEDVKKVVSIITDANMTGNAGDGKIFVVNIPETVRIRTGESNELAI